MGIGDTKPQREIVTDGSPLPWRHETVYMGGSVIYDAKGNYVAVARSFEIAELWVIWMNKGES